MHSRKRLANGFDKTAKTDACCAGSWFSVTRTPPETLDATEEAFCIVSSWAHQDCDPSIITAEGAGAEGSKEHGTRGTNGVRHGSQADCMG